MSRVCLAHEDADHVMRRLRRGCQAAPHKMDAVIGAGPGGSSPRADRCGTGFSVSGALRSLRNAGDEGSGRLTASANRRQRGAPSEAGPSGKHR